jgi:predicted dehydrogenase
MRFGIAGAGVIATTHAKLIDSIPEAELVAIADEIPDRAQALTAKHGGQALTSVEELVARDDIDTISVCLPSGLHAYAAVQALDAGKNVIIEKPIDVTLEAADRIIEAERRSGKTVAVISQRRFQPSFAYLNKAIGEGKLGKVTSGISESTFWRSQEYYDSGGWRGTWELDGGGALMNQGVHALDLIVWMLGEPVEVSAYFDVLAHERIEVEDTLSATVKFANGAIGTITATTAAYPGRTVRLSINGTEGVAVIESETLQYLHTRSGENGTSDSANHVDQAPEAFGENSIHGAHRAQYADFIAAVDEGRAPGVTTADGRRALALVLAIYESARAGGAPVKLK